MLVVLLFMIRVMVSLCDTGMIVNGTVGGSIVLTPTAVTDITSITWKYGVNFAVQWDGTSITKYRHFKQRGALDVKSGSLTISDLILSDSNTYTPEINNIVQNEIQLKVYRPVPKPIISVTPKTSEEKELTCDGDTTDAEPVTCSWTLDNEEYPGTSKTIAVTKESSGSKKFRCTMHNPVSKMESDGSQPFPPPGPPITIIIVVVVVVVLIILVIIHRVISGEWFFRRDAKCWKKEFWEKSEMQSVGDNNDRGGDERKGMTNENNQ